MNKTIILILFVLIIGSVFISTGYSQNARFALACINNDAMDKTSAKTIYLITKDELEKYQMNIEYNAKLEDCRDINEVFSITASMKVNFVYAVEYRKLGSKITVVLTKYTPNNQIIYKSSLTATGVEELDKVIPRLVKSVVEGKSIESTATLSTVTSKEAKPFQKKWGESYWGIGILTPIGHVDDEGNVGFGLALRFSYEMEYLRLGARFDGVFAGGITGGFIGIECDYLFIPEDISPFVGFAFGFGGYHTDDDWTVNGSTGVELIAGIELFRMYSTRLIIDFSAFFPFKEARKEYLYGLIKTNETKYMPMFYFGVSLLW